MQTGAVMNDKYYSNALLATSSRWIWAVGQICVQRVCRLIRCVQYVFQCKSYTGSSVEIMLFTFVITQLIKPVWQDVTQAYNSYRFLWGERANVWNNLLKPQRTPSWTVLTMIKHAYNIQGMCHWWLQIQEKTVSRLKHTHTHTHLLNELNRLQLSWYSNSVP